MLTINENFLKLPGGYLFVEIARRVNAYKKANPDKKVISLGIGDVTRPLPKVVIDAMHKAVDEMSCEKTMRGYAPDRGYDFLLEAIWENDFSDKGLPIEMDEIFVSDGAKSDTGNFDDILGIENKIAVTDPVYPVYVDTNVMAGRSGVLKDGRWSDIEY
ncbi:MAG: LL-diaminopimelate aminotransferase, partial [Bacteroidales bacterium]|nr:LL-diaminopimelate aminotransferase [Bacteroidales bacterium]